MTTRSAPAAGVSEAVACAHCRLEVPLARIEPAQDDQFCCRGCQTAFDLIRGHGLGAYYSLVDPQRPAPAAVGDSDVSYGELDRPTFVQRHVMERGDGGRCCTLLLEGIHCAACVWLLEKLPRLVDGVLEARVDWSRATLNVCWDPASCRLSDVASAVAQLGYRPHPVDRETQAKNRDTARRQELARIGVAAAAAGNNMLIAIALYLGWFSSMDGSIESMLRLASCTVGLVSVAGPGRVFLQGAWSALRTRTPHMDLPIALGLGVGAVAGLINTLRGVGEIYFDTLSVLVFLLLVGRYVQSRQQHRASEAVRLLERLMPAIAHKVVGDRVRDVPSEVLEVDDLIRVRAGESFPADGWIIGGQTSVDEAILTGESRARAVAVGEHVAAGTLNVAAAVRVQVGAVGSQTRIGKVAELVESAGTRRAAIVQWADRIGAWFVAVVLMAAGATLAAWLWRDPSRAVDHTVALLIVACPCALGLATPLALSVAVAGAAKRRILIKGGDVLQCLSKPGTIWLDKTGTLTEGRISVVRWDGPDWLRSYVASLERDASHPVGRALVTYLACPGEPEPAPADRVEQSDAGGIAGRFGTMELAVGNERFLRDRGVTFDAANRRAAREIVAGGHAPVYVAVDGRTLAVAAVGDRLRPGAREAVDRLRRGGWTVGILSGDHPEIVHEVGRRLGIPQSLCLGGLTPQDKVEVVSGSGGRTVMVGDGVNDSAALAAASVGIATHEGAEASLRAAPVYLGRPGLDGVLEILAVARATMATVRRNLAVSLIYNASAVSLAAMGLINPLVAAVLMPLSSLSVVGSSLATRWKVQFP